MILNHKNPNTEHTIIRKQEGFRAGTSFPRQLLNLTQHTEDVYQKSRTIGTVLVNLSTAYEHVNHGLLLNKLYGMTDDDVFTKFIGGMQSNIRFYVELNGKKNRWCNQMNGSLTRGIQCLYNRPTCAQDTRSIIYADDMCIATQRNTFEQTETIFTDSLQNLGEY